MSKKRPIIKAGFGIAPPRNIGWAILDSGEEVHGNDLDAFIDRFADLAKGRPSALGFECPLFIPLNDTLASLTSQRVGEKGRPWSAGAGATVTTIGMAVVTYSLAQLRRKMGVDAQAGVQLDWTNWPKGNAMLVWEVFVSGANHSAPGEHWRDALHAARGFRAALPDLDACNAVTGNNVLSLVGACLLRSGWAQDPRMLEQACLVLRPEELPA